MGLRIVHVGEHVMFGLVEQGGDLAKARAELIGNVAPGLSGSLAIGLDEDLANGSRDNRLLAFRHMIPEPISSDPWQSMENQPFPTLSVISDRSELSGIGMTT